MSVVPYADPRALRSAIADRLRPLAAEREVSLENLQRQFAYERLLCRVFAVEPDRWVLKGATAMLARVGPDARHTKDVDLLSIDRDLRCAEQALRKAAAADLGDFFTFALQPASSIGGDQQAQRIPLEAYLGPRRFAQFHVDLVAELNMTGKPDHAAGLLPVQVPGLTCTDYRLYPVVDHVADKVCALHETHRRSSGVQEPSSRYRDLADLAVFAHTITVSATPLTKALTAEAQRRRIILPEAITIPTDSNWKRGYARVARDAPRLRERDLDSALQTVGRFVDPVLAGSAAGQWNPAELSWSRAR